MKKLSLTKHVLERRKKGNIPPDRLRFVMQHLIDQHSMEDKLDGAYKFRRGGTQAVIVKKGAKFRFITFFGQTGYVIDSDDIGEFNCIHQSEEYLKIKADKKALRAQRKNYRKEAKLTDPLKRLSMENQKKIKKGTFEILVIDIVHQVLLHDKMGHRPFHILVSKYNSYNFVEVLKFDGAKIQTMHKNTWEAILHE